MANYILGTLPNFLYPGPSCIVAGALPNFDGSVAGDQHLNAIAGELPNFTGNIEAATNRFGIISATLPNFTGEISGLTGRVAVLSGSLPNFAGSMSAIPHKLAAIAGSLPNFEGSVTAHFVCDGVLSGALPNFAGAISVLGTFTIISVNLANRGVMEFDNYDFDSFFSYRGKWYGVTSEGIYLLEGSTDAGAAISASLTGGKATFGLGTQSTITDVCLLTDLNGTATLSLYADGDHTGQSYTETGTGTVDNRRFTCALGESGYEWMWKLSNASGCDMDVRRIEMILDMVGRR